MKNLSHSVTNDEIHLKEVFIILWNFKLFILGFCTLGILCGGFIINTVDKKYTASSIFLLNDDKGSSFPMIGEMGALSSLANFSFDSNSSLPTDEVMGRQFIKQLDQSIDLRGDAYFNSFNPNAQSPGWKSAIKKFFRWNDDRADREEIIWQGITSTYSKNVELELTKEKAIMVSVSHVNPNRSADIANAIVSSVLKNKQDKLNTKQNSQINYLSQTVAKALRDVEDTQTKLSDFSLKNNALPLESYLAGTIQLDKLREEISKASELQKSLNKIATLLEDGLTKETDYQLLRTKYPIVDSVEFRRVLGQNEIISTWNWPDLSAVRTVLKTLSERQKLLEIEMMDTELDVEETGFALEKYAVLERDANVAKETYQILIEQVKANSILAGFRPDSSQIYEYASPPLNPSSPNRILMLALGAVLGLSLGIFISYIIAILRGVYYSNYAIVSEAKAAINIYAGPIISLRKLTLPKYASSLNSRSRNVLRGLAVEIHQTNQTQIIITSSKSKLKSADVSKSLASYMQSDNISIGIIDFSEQFRNIKKQENNDLVGPFEVADKLDKISILRPNNGQNAIEFLGHIDFQLELKALHSKFKLIFLCADNDDAISLAGAFKMQDIIHITIARRKRTKSKALTQLCTLLPIRGLLYE